jgi:hypothetical protein
MDDTGWGDLGTPEGVLATMKKTAQAARLPPTHAFTLWLAANRQRLEEDCRQSAGRAESVF